MERRGSEPASLPPHPLVAAYSSSTEQCVRLVKGYCRALYRGLASMTALFSLLHMHKHTRKNKTQPFLYKARYQCSAQQREKKREENNNKKTEKHQTNEEQYYYYGSSFCCILNEIFSQKQKREKKKNKKTKTKTNSRLLYCLSAVVIVAWSTRFSCTRMHARTSRYVAPACLHFTPAHQGHSPSSACR